MKFFPLIILILTISPYGLNAMHTPNPKQIVLAHITQMNTLDNDKVQNQSAKRSMSRTET